MDLFFALTLVSGFAALACFIIWMARGDDQDEKGKKVDRRLIQLGWSLVLITVVLWVVALILDAKADNKAEAAAVKTLEERYDITINYPGYLDSISKDDWMIDNLWRECYLTNHKMSEMATTALMCDTAGNTYAEIGTETDTSTSDTP